MTEGLGAGLFVKTLSDVELLWQGGDDVVVAASEEVLFAVLRVAIEEEELVVRAPGGLFPGALRCAWRRRRRVSCPGPSPGISLLASHPVNVEY